MENNNEQLLTQGTTRGTLIENREVRENPASSFLVEIQKGINEGELLKQKEERSIALAELENFGKQCGLTKEEAARVLEEKGFASRLEDLRSKALFSCDNFIARARKIGSIATTALVLGTSVPASVSYAAEQPSESVHSERVSVSKYDEVMTGLHRSVLTDKKERALVSVRGSDGAFKVNTFSEGEDTSAAFPSETFDLLERGEDVELVHTHPLEAATFAGLMSSEEIIKARAGEEHPRVMAPSGDADFLSVISTDTLVQKSGATVHYKVIDPTGEWSYEISNHNAPFVRMMRQLFDSVKDESKKFALSPEEKQYMDDLEKQFPDQRTLAAELKARSISTGGTAKIIWDKMGLENRMSKIIETASKDELASLEAFTQYLQGPNYFSAGTTEEKNARAVEFYEGTAKKLGFTLKYTPNKN